MVERYYDSASGAFDIVKNTIILFLIVSAIGLVSQTSTSNKVLYDIAQDSVKEAVKTIDVRGSLTEDSIDAFLKAYDRNLEKRGLPKKNNCTGKAIEELPDHEGGLPYFVYRLETGRALGRPRVYEGSHEATDAFHKDFAFATPLPKDKIFRVISADVYYSVPSIFPLISDCYVVKSSVSAIAFGNKEDLKANKYEAPEVVFPGDYLKNFTVNRNSDFVHHITWNRTDFTIHTISKPEDMDEITEAKKITLSVPSGNHNNMEYRYKLCSKKHPDTCSAPYRIVLKYVGVYGAKAGKFEYTFKQNPSDNIFFSHELKEHEVPAELPSYVTSSFSGGKKTLQISKRNISYDDLPNELMIRVNCFLPPGSSQTCARAPYDIIIKKGSVSAPKPSETFSSITKQNYVGDGKQFTYNYGSPIGKKLKCDPTFAEFKNTVAPGSHCGEYGFFISINDNIPLSELGFETRFNFKECDSSNKCETLKFTIEHFPPPKIVNG